MPSFVLLLTLLMLEWNHIYRYKKLHGGSSSVVSRPINSIKFNFDICSLGNSGKIRIYGVFECHFMTILLVFSKFAIENIAIEVEIQILLKGLLPAKALRFQI